MSDVLSRWNSLTPGKAAEEILPCCGSKAWAEEMARRRPIQDEAALLAACDEIWKNLSESAWMEAFQSHPRIGESDGPGSATAQSATWSKNEQQEVASAEEGVKTALAYGNRAYELKFKRTFIVCATGKSGMEILDILRRRLRNDDKAELLEAAEEQRQIAHVRLRKWLSS